MTKTSMAPAVPAGTIAAFATNPPPYAFKVETNGRGCPSAQAERYCSGPVGQAVMFSDYACADVGIPQEPDGSGKLRVSNAFMAGGPNAPVLPA